MAQERVDSMLQIIIDFHKKGNYSLELPSSTVEQTIQFMLSGEDRDAILRSELGLMGRFNRGLLNKSHIPLFASFWKRFIAPLALRNTPTFEDDLQLLQAYKFVSFLRSFNLPPGTRVVALQGGLGEPNEVKDLGTLPPGACEGSRQIFENLHQELTLMDYSFTEDGNETRVFIEPLSLTVYFDKNVDSLTRLKVERSVPTWVVK